MPLHSTDSKPQNRPGTLWRCRISQKKPEDSSKLPWLPQPGTPDPLAGPQGRPAPGLGARRPKSRSRRGPGLPPRLLERILPYLFQCLLAARNPQLPWLVKASLQSASTIRAILPTSLSRGANFPLPLRTPVIGLALSLIQNGLISHFNSIPSANTLFPHKVRVTGSEDLNFGRDPIEPKVK